MNRLDENPVVNPIEADFDDVHYAREAEDTKQREEILNCDDDTVVRMILDAQKIE